jgi:hypothetical protein
MRLTIMQVLATPWLGAVLLFGATIVIPGSASAAWPILGRPITTAPKAQLHSVISTDGAGRVNIFARRVLGSGELDPAWPELGRALLRDTLALAAADGGQTTPLLVADGTGGAIAVWHDLRAAATDVDLFAQHVLADGTVDPAWPDNGTPVTRALGNQGDHVVVSDGAGGVLVAWSDTRLGVAQADIFAQHLLASGIADPRWPADGLALCSAPAAQGFPAIASDGAGGGIVSWDDPRAGAFDVFAQHVRANGTVDPAWPVNGLAVCSAAGDQGRSTIVSDGAHGAVVAWSDTRLANTSHIFAQHLLASGAVDPAWPVNGRGISAAAVSETRPLAVADGTGGALVNWQGFTTQLNMYLQHVTAAGIVDPLWPAAGKPLSDAERQQSHAEIVADGTGGAIVVWQDGDHLLAQHVLANAVTDPAYPPAGRPIASGPGAQVDAALVATGIDGAIVSWSDTRSGVDLDIFALQIANAAATDVPPPTVRAVTFDLPRPNPGREALTLRFALPAASSVRLDIYDAAGRKVRALTAGSLPAGEQTLQWDFRDDLGAGVRAGIYLARLEVKGRVLTRKVVRVD